MSLRLSHEEIEEAVVEHLTRRGFVVPQGVQVVLLQQVQDGDGDIEALVEIETPAARLPRAEG